MDGNHYTKQRSRKPTNLARGTKPATKPGKRGDQSADKPASFLSRVWAKMSTKPVQDAEVEMMHLTKHNRFSDGPEIHDMAEQDKEEQEYMQQ